MQNELLVQKYKRYLLLEKGLSKNTISAYLTDLRKLIKYVEMNELSVKDLKTSHLEEFLAELYDQGIKARSKGP